MLIRPMIEDDIPVIAALEKELFPNSPWNEQDFRFELSQSSISVNLVLEIEQQVVGYVGMWLLGDQSQITTLGVSKAYQQRGCARRLMEEAEQMTREKKYPRISLEVRVSNIPAISLYKRLGYKEVAVRKNYYQDTHEDAYLMLKEWEV